LKLREDFSAEREMISPVLAEYLGTTAFLSSIAFVGTPAVIAGTLFVVILLIGKISGGHVNPAITLWAFLSGKVNQTKAVSYVGAQLAGAVTVYLLSSMLR
jgi:glycerol uptake facilitator-like aquaporin